MMTSNLDLRLADPCDAPALAGEYADPMFLAERLPEVSVPVALLKPWFHLRQDGTDAAHVRLLADASGSVRLPSILVQKRDLRIIDGMHRVEVARLRGETSIVARIVDCSDEEALVLAVKSNTLHGLPLTRPDRISSAKRILGAHPDWSDRALAGITGLSAKSISSLRNTATADAPFTGKRLGRDGKRRPVTPADGRQRAAEYLTAHPGAPLREVAKIADISLGTVHDVRERLRRGDPAQPRDFLRPAPDHADHAPDVAQSPSAQASSAQASSAQASPAQASPAPGMSAPGSSAPGMSAPGPSAPDKPARPAPAVPVQRHDWLAISAKVTRDPTVRYTEGGRAFLRWMAAHAARVDEWAEFVDAIPEHWLEEVGRTAVSMSEEWRLFAERLSSRLERGA